MSLKDFIPPIVVRLGARLKASPYGWSGDFSTWEEARKVTQGYDAASILNHISGAVEKVKSGKAVYERDGVLFDEVQYSWPLLAGLLWSAARHGGSLRVMDFGGSLGSSYFQNRAFFAGLSDVAWGVVEQADFVKEGKRKFEDHSLKFFSDAGECIREMRPNVYLFSCVLQYLESPYEHLKQLLSNRPELVIVDNMPFIEGKKRLTVQKVPPEIYPASYPCWILNRGEFMRIFDGGYRLASAFESPLAIRLDGKVIPYAGFIYQRND